MPRLLTPQQRSVVRTALSKIKAKAPASLLRAVAKEQSKNQSYVQEEDRTKNKGQMIIIEEDEKTPVVTTPPVSKGENIITK
eukprot:3801773-Amphidinium_carterae.1